MDFRRRAPLALAALALLAVPRVAHAEDEFDAAGSLAVALALEPSFVRVEVALRFDEGQPPSTVGSDFSGLVTQERPYELTGFVLAPDRVLVSDPQLHPRFVSAIHVVDEGAKVPATPWAWLSSADGLVLALERPLAGAKPIAFAKDAVPPFRAVWHGKHDGVWMTTVGPAARRVTRTETGEAWVDSWAPTLLVDAAGKVAGLTLDDRMPVEGVPGSPLDLPSLRAEEREALVAKTKALADGALLRVHLRLRSPKADASERVTRRFRFGGDDDDDNATERHAVGVAVGGKRVLVLETLEPKVTSRLDSVDVHPAEGDPIPATFVCSLRHYGALLVECERELPVSVRLRPGSIRDVRNALLLDARVEVQGESRVVHCGHARLDSFDEAWRGQLVPEAGQAEHHFLFDREGALVALPVRRRLPDQERWHRDEVVLLPAAYLAPVLADAAAHADPANAPVAAERENRLAWLGVETQRLDRELARANAVSHLTQDGKTGALVSYVYPGSPAAKAGVEAGTVLLRVHVPDRPKPVDVAASEDSSNPFASMMEALGDEAGEAMGAMGIHPWPSAESEINRLLTDVGVGKTVGLEYASGGAVKRVDLPIEEGPVHHEAAPLRKSESLGTTVRDLTYEVRRYYQLDDTVTGVIVSKVERGTRAAVAGLRRFDIVLKVDDQPVPDVVAFEKATDKGGALRLTVKDRLKERVVKIAEAKSEAK